MNLTKKDIKEIKKNQIKKIHFNKGYFGSFYLISKDKGIKLVTNQDAHFRFHFDLEEFIPLTDIKIHGVSLPEEIGYDERGNFKGYTLPYFEGPNVPKALRKNKTVPWSTIDHYFDTLYDKIIDLTNHDVLIYDIQPHNIIVSDNELKIIDCDFFKFEKDTPKQVLYIENMFQLRLGIDRIKNKKLKEHVNIYFNKKRGTK